MAGPVIPSSFPDAYAYPREPHVRRHGPSGWKTYRRYQPWLRDDFAFRCVFCLVRERWNDMRRSFHIDHFLPQALRPDLGHEYTNLLLLCPSCNETKRTALVPDPCQIALAACLQVRSDGTIEALNTDGERLILELALDDESLTNYRRMMIGLLTWFAATDWAQFVDWMRFPDNLPDLSQLRPRNNTKPEGVEASWFAKRIRGELPEVY